MDLAISFQTLRLPSVKHVESFFKRARYALTSVMSEPDPYDAVRQLVQDADLVLDDENPSTEEYPNVPSHPFPQIRYSESEENRDDLADKYAAEPVAPVSNLQLLGGDVLQRSAGQLSTGSTGSNPVLLFAADHVENKSDDEEPIVLSAHQPTFVSISGLVPRGYESVRALKKGGIRECGSVVDRWDEIGYDPKMGRGKVKQIKEAHSTIVGPYGRGKGQPRFGRLVSSSEGPRPTNPPVPEDSDEDAKLFQSDGDDAKLFQSDGHDKKAEDEDVKLFQSDGDDKKAEDEDAKLFQSDGEGFVVDEVAANKPLKLEPWKFVGKTPIVAVSRKTTKPYWGVHKTLEGDTFVTQMEGSGPLAKIQKETVPRKAATASVTRRRGVDLSKYDKEDFDWENEGKKIPHGLLDMVTHSPISIVFRALCQESMAQYPGRVVSEVIAELKVYLDKCVKEGMIGESSYVEWIIENIKEEMKGSGGEKNDREEKVGEELKKVEEKYNERKAMWKRQMEVLQVEKKVALQALEEQYEEKIARLDEEWQSEKMHEKYGRPSVQLMTMRGQALAYLKSHQFSDAQAVADLVARQEKQEIADASKRMRKDYQAAIDRLQKKMMADKAAVAESYDAKMNGIVTAQNQELRPYEQRIENLKRTKKEVTRRSLPGRDTSTERRMPVTTKTGPVIIHARLNLPPLRQSGPVRSRTGSAVRSRK